MKMMIIGFGSFLLFAFLFFVILKVSEPNKQASNSAKQTSAKPNNKYVKNLEKRYKKLKEDLAKSKADFSLKDTKLDSLKKLVTQLETNLGNSKNQMEKLNEKLTKAENEEKNAQDLAKTFASMKSEEMRPILINIDDRTIKRIYKKINNRMKKNFLLALTPQRAASLTKQLAAAN